ncbi:cytochrome b/b6 domain-containing protein [Pseudoduganella sp. OTU4001]|uniref:cytochrome b/b6 domain-containing protein n=1 Tax=Pseudoduganella sp. OTU4001 TaxID=3043854 RepID=UPI00313DDCA4
MQTIKATPGHSQAEIDVWDAPTRVLHWLMVLCFAGAYLTSEGRIWRALHVTFGYTMAGLLVFRVIWGIIGTRYARFTNFVRAPAAAWAYLRSLLTRHPQHFAGHNPAGGLAIIALLATGAAVTLSGWVALQESSKDLWEDVHETFANLMLALVLLHVAAVVFSSWLHHENLVASMIHGRKAGPAGTGIRHLYRSIGVLLLLAVAGFWYLRWR